MSKEDCIVYDEVFLHSSLPLRGTFVASVGRETFVGSIGHFRYVELGCRTLVASAGYLRDVKS